MKRVKKLFLKYHEIISYLFFGSLTTMVSLSSYYLLVTTFLDVNHPFELQIANITSWIIAVTFAYITNKRYVFKPTNKKVLKEMSEFYLARLASLIIDMGLMFIFVSLYHLNDKIMKVIVQIIVIITNYLLSKLVVFKNKS